MIKIFESVTFRVTAGYMLILMTICLVFSFIIYSIADQQISDQVPTTADIADLNASDAAALIKVRMVQRDDARQGFVRALSLTNLLIWTIGGGGSIFLARRSLRPIEATHEAQARFASEASHQLKTPLTSMRAELEVALRDPKLRKTEMKEILLSNLEEVKRLTTLSEKLLAISRLDKGAILSQKVSLGNTIRAAAKRQGKQKVRIHISPSKSLFVDADPTMLDQLLSILIDNAIKYSPPASPITIWPAEPKGRLVGFSIMNTGEGIPAETIEHIFEPFYRSASLSATATPGYGLGLAIAKRIVEVSYGELSVTSAEGESTTFTVLLPLYVSNS